MALYLSAEHVELNFICKDAISGERSPAECAGTRFSIGWGDGWPSV